MRAGRLHSALESLSAAMREVEAAVEEMRSEQDPLAVHIFVARRAYRNMDDNKSGKGRGRAAISTWQTACDLGYRGDLREWERILGAYSAPH